MQLLQILFAIFAIVSIFVFFPLVLIFAGIFWAVVIIQYLVTGKWPKWFS